MFNTSTQAMAAVGRIGADVTKLANRRNNLLADFRHTADCLLQCNEELTAKTALCEELITQLVESQECMQNQIKANDHVRGKILGLIGE